MFLSRMWSFFFRYFFFFLLCRPPPRSTLFPYTTLFRSHLAAGDYVELVAFQNSANSTTISNSAASRPLFMMRSEEHTSELQSRRDLVCRLLLEKKNHSLIQKLF